MVSGFEDVRYRELARGAELARFLGSSVGVRSVADSVQPVVSVGSLGAGAGVSPIQSGRVFFAGGSEVASGPPPADANGLELHAAAISQLPGFVDRLFSYFLSQAISGLNLQALIQIQDQHAQTGITSSVATVILDLIVGGMDTLAQQYMVVRFDQQTPASLLSPLFLDGTSQGPGPPITLVPSGISTSQALSRCFLGKITGARAPSTPVCNPAVAVTRDYNGMSFGNNTFRGAASHHPLSGVLPLLLPPGFVMSVLDTCRGVSQLNVGVCWKEVEIGG